MISFDSLTLKAFVEENKEYLIDARIQKIQQPTRRDFLITVRKQGISKKLYININPQLHHICFVTPETEKKRRIEIPKEPPMFCMLLRKHLENALIKEIKQPQHERIFEIYVEAYNELNEKIYLCLAVELMGKHSNVILYNTNTNVIIGCAHNVGAEKSRDREVAGTLPYIYPPKQNKLDINNFNGQLEHFNLSTDFYDFSKYFSELCQTKSIDELRKYINLENITPAIEDDFNGFSLYSELLENPQNQTDVNSMVDNYFSYHQEKEKINTLKSTLLGIIQQKLKKTVNSLKKMQSQIDREKNSERYRIWADLIMSNLYSASDYTNEINVFDWESNKNITITMDSTKTLKENANTYYKLYNKGKTSKIKLTELINDLTGNKNYLEQIVYFINSAKTYEDLLEIKTEIIPNDNNKKISDKRALEPKKISMDGYTIYIGKNNRQNDYIVSKLAKDEDLWFHTKDCPGSHVLLKSENINNELILYCAQLAKENSSGKQSSKVGVIYTKRKYLKKPPKANLGYVTYRNEKEIIID